MSEATRRRRLRKYEADARIHMTVASESGEPPLDCYSPFGPLIARTRISHDLVEHLNRFADAHAASDRSSEFLLPPAFLNEGGGSSVAVAVERLIRRYLASVEDSRVEQIQFENFWIVSQYAQTASPVHFHSGDISGVLYLKVPEIDSTEDERTYISGRQAGYINFLIGGKQRFSKSLISFRPEVGDFYIFPGWLLHGAEPFVGPGERRSMAFNAFVRSAEP